MEKLDKFIDMWPEDQSGNRTGFLRFTKQLKELNNTVLEFIPREGLTYSLRAKHVKQKDKALFVIIDVIEDEPRWLSVCFYAEMIHDNGAKGDFVPGGILGEDAVCFDMDEYNNNFADYLADRINEAFESASR